MGFKYLPIGLKYFSVSEEIEVISKVIFKFLLNLTPGFYMAVFIIFVASILVYSFVYAKLNIMRLAV